MSKGTSSNHGSHHKSNSSNVPKTSDSIALVFNDELSRLTSSKSPIVFKLQAVKLRNNRVLYAHLIISFMLLTIFLTIHFLQEIRVYCLSNGGNLCDIFNFFGIIVPSIVLIDTLTFIGVGLIFIQVLLVINGHIKRNPVKIE